VGVLIENSKIFSRQDIKDAINVVISSEKNKPIYLKKYGMMKINQ